MMNCLFPIAFHFKRVTDCIVKIDVPAIRDERSCVERLNAHFQMVSFRVRLLVSRRLQCLGKFRFGFLGGAQLPIKSSEHSRRNLRSMLTGLFEITDGFGPVSTVGTPATESGE